MFRRAGFICQRLSGKKGVQAGQCGSRDVLQRLIRQKGLMRRQQDIGFGYEQGQDFIPRHRIRPVFIEEIALLFIDI